MLRYRHLTIIPLLLLCGSVAAAEISIVGVMGKKALLVIDGGKPRWLAVGESSGGVKLIGIAGDAAITAAGGNQSATLTADHGGQFFADGAINGVAVRFLIDTGASYVSMNTSDAKR